jgi:hypothetical protein
MGTSAGSVRFGTGDGGGGGASAEPDAIDGAAEVLVEVEFVRARLRGAVEVPEERVRLPLALLADDSEEEAEDTALEAA